MGPSLFLIREKDGTDRQRSETKKFFRCFNGKKTHILKTSFKSLIILHNLFLFLVYRLDYRTKRNGLL